MFGTNFFPISRNWTSIFFQDRSSLWISFRFVDLLDLGNCISPRALFFWPLLAGKFTMGPSNTASAEIKLHQRKRNSKHWACSCAMPRIILRLLAYFVLVVILFARSGEESTITKTVNSKYPVQEVSDNVTNVQDLEE
jgi:hypothetical protein